MNWCQTPNEGYCAGAIVEESLMLCSQCTMHAFQLQMRYSLSQILEPHPLPSIFCHERSQKSLFETTTLTHNNISTSANISTASNASSQSSSRSDTVFCLTITSTQSVQKQICLRHECNCKSFVLYKGTIKKKVRLKTYFH